MNQRAFYRRQRNRRLNHDKRLTHAYSKAIGAVYAMVLAGIRAGKGKGSIPSTKAIQGALKRQTQAAYIGVIDDGMLYGLNDAEELYGRRLPIFMEKAVSREDLANLGMGAVRQQIVEESMEKIVLKEIPKTMKNTLALEFERSALANEGRRELTERIMARAELDKVYKARRIAQTETTRAFNSGTLEGYKKSTVVNKKVWLTNMGGNPREDHAAANGQERDVDKPFSVGGEDMMCPGDGSVEQCVNCHCAMMPKTGKPERAPAEERPTAGTAEQRFRERVDERHLDVSRGFREISDEDLEYTARRVHSGRLKDIDYGRAGVEEAEQLVRQYTLREYTPLRQNYLKAVERRAKGLKLNAAQQRSVLLQDMCSQHQISSGTKLYRGLNFDSTKKFDLFMNGIKENGLELNAMSSFSGKANIAMDFATEGKVGVRLVCQSDGAISGLKATSVSHIKQEAETILAAGQKFSVSSMKFNKSRNVWDIALNPTGIAKKLTPKENKEYDKIIFDAFNKPLSNRAKTIKK